jgi:hypothetical protein
MRKKKRKDKNKDSPYFQNQSKRERVMYKGVQNV